MTNPRPQQLSVALALTALVVLLVGCGNSDPATLRGHKDISTLPPSAPSTDPPTTTTTAPSVKTVELKWSYVDDDGWHYEGTIDAVLPALKFSKDVSEAPPERARLMVQYDGPNEAAVDETVEPVDEGRQGPSITLRHGLLIFPFSVPYERGQHSGLDDDDPFAPCMQEAPVYDFDFPGFENGYLICNPSAERVETHLTALDPLARSGSPEPASPVDNLETGLDAAMPALNSTPGYLISDPGEYCPDYVLVDGSTLVKWQVTNYDQVDYDACTFRVEVAS